MNTSDTQIIVFKDTNSSVFTLKLGKSYNMTKYNKKSILGVKKYCFKIINCVSTDVFVVEYHDQDLRNTEYKKFVNDYISFNGMKKE